jgi:hypothetical protein
MKEDHAFQLVAVQDGPSPSKYVLRFVIAVPSELNGGQSVTLRELAVHLTVDTSELKLASVATFEFNERLEFLWFFFYVPLIHVLDQPSTQERIGSFASSHVIHLCWSIIFGHFNGDDVNPKFQLRPLSSQPISKMERH